MKIIFMGTPDFACPALKKLIENKEFEIVAVYSKEPQIAGRGHKLTNSAVHNLALEHGLKVLTPKTLRDKEVQEEFKNFNADAAAVVAYGLLLPQEILNGTKYGCFNIHPSLLPRWRGAAPIQRMLMAGDLETSVDIIKMDKGLDSGDIVAREIVNLKGDETYASLAPQLAEIGADLLAEALKQAKNLSGVIQDSSHATYAKKIEKSECEIDWNNSAKEIERKIRALNGSMEAHFIYNGEKIKIFSTEIIDENSKKNPVGNIDEKFCIQCGQGVMRPLILQRQGKNKVTIEEFLRGLRK